jgi:hypothetical protein
MPLNSSVSMKLETKSLTEATDISISCSKGARVVYKPSTGRGTGFAGPQAQRHPRGAESYTK